MFSGKLKMTRKTSKKDALVPSWACHSVRPVFFHLTSRLNHPSVTLGVVKASLLANVLFKNFSNRSSLPSVTGSLNPIRQPLPHPETLWRFWRLPPLSQPRGGRRGSRGRIRWGARGGEERDRAPKGPRSPRGRWRSPRTEVRGTGSATARCWRTRHPGGPAGARSPAGCAPHRAAGGKGRSG